MISRPAPASLYQLHYAAEPATCNQGFPGEVHVWGLQAAAPYDQESMVVLSNAARVQVATQHRWVALPGQLVANWLVRDLSQDPLFTAVVTPGEALAAPFDLGGHLFTFGWKRQEESSQALLDLEMTLTETRPGRIRNILFRKHYQLTGKPYPDPSPEGFARAMSDLLREFSAQLRRDLCTGPIPARDSPVTVHHP